MERHDPPSQQRVLQHLVVLVHGLWGWQTDFYQMRKALEAHNDGSYLFCVSAVNVGFLTYDGIDVCGQRLAQEVQHLISTTPSLTNISLIGHSMGGLIARYAIGLLADPVRGTVAGLQPQSYISLATPHLGCSSNHPDEIHWQGRPYMRWLAAAVAAGHLGGREHLVWPPAAAPSKQTGAAVPAAAATSQAAEQAAAAAAGKEAGGNKGIVQQASGSSGTGSNRGCCGCGSSHVSTTASATTTSTTTSNTNTTNSKTTNSNSTSSTTSNSTSKATNSTSRSKAGRGWPWTPFRSLVQLLGCDAWQPSAHTLTVTQSPCCCTSCGACGVHTESSSNNSSNSASNSASNSKPSTTPRAPHSSSSSSSSKGDSSSSSMVEWCISEGTGPAEEPVQLLDALCRDVQVTCIGCGERRRLWFFSGLSLFQHRVTYSSAGGDHLIPWASSALVAQQQLPVRAASQASKAAAAAAQGDTSQQLQLPVLGLWATKPVLVEQQVNPVPLQQGQQLWPPPREATSPQQQQQQPQHLKEPGFDGSSSSMAHSSSRPVGVLAARLQQLQALNWRRFHVVWPRLVLGSSHCNIQYNGPTNFAGRAVVEHVCGVLLAATVPVEGLKAATSATS